jgi:type I restriction enzyme M protein
MSFAEQQTEWIISNNLVNKEWVIDINSNKNVFFQKPPTEEQRKKLKGKRPDYILCKTGTTEPIAIIEAKKGGVDLKEALKQGTEYAEVLECPLVFAMNGAYCETRFIPNGKELILNKNEVRELIREVECLEFIRNNTNEVCTIPEEILISREELIRVFKGLNDILRCEGLRAGIERFSEFSNILFLKLMSENNKKSWWNSIKSQSNDDIIGYINSYVINEVKSEYGGDVFTPLLIKNPKTLRSIIDKLDPLILSTIDTDVKGDAFEYFLEQTTSTENDLGEYFTPRHIVKSIVNLVDPKFKETVYDPFCGTGGFLTSAFHYIKENSIIEGSEDLQRLKQNTLFGREITTTARIAKMNMVLHGDGHSGIEQIDTLANPVEEKHDVIITNMPFSQKKASYSNLYYNGLAKNNSDALCILHCLQSLKKGGRMALVVPEGFLFRKNIARIREFLLSKCKLQSVISLPSGVFLPYTGVKTDILYFTNAHEQNNQKEYWYFDVKNIGYTLDNNRRKLKGKNDLNKLAESDFKKVEKDTDLRQNMLEVGFEPVLIQDIKFNYWNYIPCKELKIPSNYQIVKLKDICNVVNGYAFKSSFFSNTEGFPLIRIRDIKTNSTNTRYNNEDYDIKYIVENGDIIIGMDGEFNAVMWQGGKALLNQRIALLQPSEKILKKFLYNTIQKPLKKIEEQTSFTTVKHISSQQILNIQIPLPSLEEQQKIVDEIEKQEQEKALLKQRISEIESNIKNSINKIWE